MTVDDTLSHAVQQYVGLDRSPVPGRHPDRVPADQREVLEEIVRRLDSIRPGDSAVDLFDWAEGEIDTLLADFPPVSAEARDALVSLLSFIWR